jgi:LysR family transcriptional regulator, cyn operon transcriptional activator
MNLRQLQTFVTIAEAGGFASAQDRLPFSQPAASRQIQALESELGLLLFNRVGRRIQLTSEGEDLLRRCRHLLQAAEAIGERARALKGGEAGTLRVGASPQHIETVLAFFLPLYRADHPSVEVSLVEDGGARLPDRLERGDIHLALIPEPAELFEYQRLAPLVLLAIMPKGHAMAKGGFLAIEQLGEEPLIVLRRDYASRGWFDTACDLAQIRPRLALECSNPHTVLAMAATGHGIGIVPSNVHLPAVGPRILILHRQGKSIGRWASIAWDRRRFLSVHARQFIDELAAYCRELYPNLGLVGQVPTGARPVRGAKRGHERLG